MSDSSNRIRTPWHVWLVGVLALLWNSLGAFDYVMTKTKNEGYMESFPPEHLEYFYSLPAWVVACWATAVWLGVLGAILLLMKRKAAVWVFFVSFLAALGTTIYNYGLSSGFEILGTFGFIFAVVILVIAFLLYLYARAMRNKATLV